jgi:RHS repeat-associated protein
LLVTVFEYRAKSSKNPHVRGTIAAKSPHDATDKSRDQVTKFIYNGAGQVKELIALDANGDGNQSDNQSTKYLYEDTVSASLKTNEIYPDSSDTSSSGSDQVKFQYNVAGEMTQSTDQRGTVIQYTFTNERRLEIENVTTLGTNVDGHVRCKKRSYDSLARLEKYTSYANTGGTGTIRNELQYAYDGLMNVTQIYQSHEGAVNTSSTPKVSFGYDATLSGGGSGDVYQYGYRRNQVTYPDGRVVFYDFDTANAGDLFSRMSKVRRIRETNVSGTILSEYSYTGVGRPAIVDMPQPKVKLDHFQGTSGTYAGWDRFGRTRQQYWSGYGGTANVDRVYYDYDYAGNRLYSDIDNAIYTGDDRDQAYSYDSGHRLQDYQQGTLSGGTISGTPVQEQQWGLDALGNWSNFVKKSSGMTDLDQFRTVNDVNEIVDITETTGPSWVTPGYDAAGSMTTIPNPGSPTASYTATYDAWHRLVKLTDGSTTIAEYEYDATKQRIVKSIYVSGVLDQRHHFYYNDQWQVVEMRRELSGTENPNPLAQYVWHPHYVDAILLRDYDSNTGGTAERYYYTQDVIFNVMSIVSASGTVLERYSYTPYGQAEVLTASFTPDPDGKSDSDNDITFTGQRFDAESRLMLYRHRFYHTGLGTFCSRDPVGYRAGWNKYQYVRARPLTSLDPSGLIDTILGPSGGWGPPGAWCQHFNTTPKKKCCDVAKEKFGNDGVFGMVVCCDGKLTACVYPHPSNKVGKGIPEMCTKLHEEEHKKHQYCLPGKGVQKAKWKSVSNQTVTNPDGIVSYVWSECEAHKVHLDCLETNKKQCGEDKACLDAINAEMVAVEKFLKYWCGIWEESNEPTPVIDESKIPHWGI